MCSVDTFNFASKIYILTDANLNFNVTVYINFAHLFSFYRVIFHTAM